MCLRTYYNCMRHNFLNLFSINFEEIRCIKFSILSHDTPNFVCFKKIVSGTTES